MDASRVLKRLSWIDRVVIPVWIGLTILMFLSFYLLTIREGTVWNNYTYHLLYLIIIVWLYPLYTLGFSSLKLGLFGNALVGISSLYVFIYLLPEDAAAALCILPTLVWVSLGSTLMAVKVKLKKKRYDSD